MAFEIFTSAQEMAEVMFQFIIIVIILQTLLFFNKIIQDFVRPRLRRFSEKSKRSFFVQLAVLLYYIAMIVIVVVIVLVFTSPSGTYSTPPTDASLWNVLMALLPVIILFKFALWLIDHVTRMGKGIGSRR